MGDDLKATVTWELNLDDISYYISECVVRFPTVSDDDVAVDLIKNTCYSDTLGVKISSARLNEFTFRTFSASGAVDSEQTIICKVIICQGHSCGLTITKEAVCPTENNLIYQWQNVN